MFLFHFLFWLPRLLSASGQGSVSKPAGGSQVWDEPSHQPQAQRDFYAGGVQQHQPSGAAVGIRQSQPAAHLTAWHEGMEDTALICMVLEVWGYCSWTCRHLHTDTDKKNGYSLTIPHLCQSSRLTKYRSSISPPMQKQYIAQGGVW